jgi:aquaporin Z
VKRYLTEFIGTFFLVFTIGLAVLSGSAVAPIAIGSALMVMVYMGGHVSGAHYNPAVTLAVLLRGKLDARDVVPYWLSQIAGALAASAAVYVITGKTFAPAPAAGATTLAVLLVEILFTFALALVVLNVATAKKTSGNSFYGLAIGFTVLAGAFAGGPVSGGAFNPAVGIGPILVDTIAGTGSLANLWYYIVGPLAGAAAAAAVFMVQESDE